TGYGGHAAAPPACPPYPVGTPAPASRHARSGTPAPARAAVTVAALVAAWPFRPSPCPDVDIRGAVGPRAGTGIGPPGSICGSDQ
ncbi:hypothetical protein PV648_11200, partial [Streptomyces sp. ID05-47C]|nr:hypothetical protein [Streptomyces sp. ID05-47C]